MSVWLQWVMPNRVVDLLACWKAWFPRQHNGDIWNAIPLCIMWTLERGHQKNCLKHLNEQLGILRYIYIYIYIHILHYLYERMAHLIGCSCVNLFSWMLHILLIWFWSHSITHPVYLMVIWCLNFTYYQYKRVKEVESWHNSNCLPPKVIGHRFESKNQLL